MSHMQIQAPKLTFLDTVFLGALVICVFQMPGDALGALVVVVLQGGTLGGFGALYRRQAVSFDLVFRVTKGMAGSLSR